MSVLPMPPDAQNNFNLCRIDPQCFVWVGKPAAGGVLHQQLVTYMSINAGLSAAALGGPGVVANVWANTAPTSTAAFTVNYIRPTVSVTPVLMGTITLTAGSKYLGTVVSTSAFNLLPGDVLQVVAPAVQDATMADVAVMIPMFAT